MGHLRSKTKSYNFDKIEETLQRRQNQTIFCCNKNFSTAVRRTAALIQTISQYENENRALINQIVTDPVDVWRFEKA